MSVQDPIGTSTRTSTVSIGDLPLESGEVLPSAELAYERTGPVGAPAILICHALTGNQHAVGGKEQEGWWAGLVGPGRYIDTDRFQVITFNVIGGCHGSTGPASLNPETGHSYRLRFPAVTIRDMVHAQFRALHQLGIDTLHAVIGGSLGGMQAYEWGLLYPVFMKKIFILAATPFLSDYGIAFNHIGARAIKDDPQFQNGQYQSNDNLYGFEIARMAGMVTYRSGKLFEQRFNRTQKNQDFAIQSYLDHQGEKIKKRFDACSYLYLLQAMNHHDIGRNRGGWELASEQYQAEVFTMSFEHDLLYPDSAMSAFSKLVKKGEHKHQLTSFGHDGFLVEFSEWGKWIEHHLS